jgi:hypothetical protein
MNQLTSGQAFEAMHLFLEGHYQQTHSDDVGTLLCDMDKLPDGLTVDPAAWEDWIECVAKVGAADSPEQAFEAMRLFLEMYHQQTHSDDIALLLADIEKLPSGSTADPAAWEDWIECVAKASASDSR